MEKQMNRRLKIGLVLAILVAIAILAAFLVTEIRQSQFQERAPPIGGFIPGDFEYFYFVFTIFSTIDIALLIVLLLIYADIYIKTRSQFTIGLIIFASVFLMKDLAASPLVAGLFSFRAYGLGPFAFLPGVFECAALSILLYLSIKY
jgi:hypothetical protein